MTDLIDELVGIVPGDRLDALRAKRPIARRDAQATYDGLFTNPDDLARASALERAAIGYWVAALSRADTVSRHYRDLLATVDPDVAAALEADVPAASASGPYGSYPPGPLSGESVDGPRWVASADLVGAVGRRLATALEHAHLVTFRPREASPDALQALLDVGWTADGIVTVSQLVAFIHFQFRVVAGLTALKEAN